MKKTLKCALFLTLIVLALFAVTMLGASAAVETDDGTVLTDENCVELGYPVKAEAQYYEGAQYFTSLAEALSEFGGYPPCDLVITLFADIEESDAIAIEGMLDVECSDQATEGKIVINGADFTATSLSLAIGGEGYTSVVELNDLHIVDGGISTKTGVTLTINGGSIVTGSGNAITIAGGEVTVKGAEDARVTITATGATACGIQVTAAADALVLDYVDIQGSEAAVKVGVDMTTGVTISNASLNAVGYGTNDKAWAFHAAKQCALVATNVTFTHSVGDGGAAKGNAPICNFGDCSGDYAWTFVNVTVTPISGKFAFDVCNNLTINAGEGGFELSAQYLFTMRDKGTLKLVGTKENPIKATGTTYFVRASAGNKVNAVELSYVTVNAGYFAQISAAGVVFNATLDKNSSVTASQDKQISHSQNSGVVTITGGNWYGPGFCNDKLTYYVLNDLNMTVSKSYGIIRLAVAGSTATINGGTYITTVNYHSFRIDKANCVLTINGGYFQNGTDDIIEVKSGAIANINGGYFYRTNTAANDSSFIEIGGGSTANVYAGTFVADYNDRGYVFDVLAANAVLNAYAYNGVGSSVITYNTGSSSVVTANNWNYTFNVNGIKVYNSAALRIDAENGVAKSGLRFTSYVTVEFLNYVNAQKADETTVSYGTVIVPVKYLEGVRYFSVETVSKALVIPATEAGMLMDDGEGGDNGMFIRASIYNLPRATEGEESTTEMLYNDSYAVIVYAEYTNKNGDVVRYYTGYDEEKNVADAASLAKAAQKDVSETQTGAYVNEVTVGGKVVYSKYTQAELDVIAVYAADFVNTAEVGGKIYGSLEAAIAAADAGATITLLEDTTIIAPLNIDKKLTINGQNYTLTMTANGHIFNLVAGSDLTVNNLNAVNAFDGTWSATIFKPNGAVTLTVNGGSYEAFGVGLYGEGCANSVITLNTKMSVRSGVGANPSPVVVNAAFTLIINGGEYYGSPTASGNAVRVMSAGANVTINGGTFDAQGKAYAINNAVGAAMTIDADNVTVQNYADGTYNWIEGVEVAGTWGAFEVEGTTYNTWAEALAAVPAGGTITILKDFTFNATVNLNKNITIEGGGFTYTVTASVHAFTLGTATIVMNELNVVNTANSSYGAAIFKQTGTANLTVNGGEFEAYGVVLYGEGGSNNVYVLNDVTFRTRGNGGKSEHVASILVSNATNTNITINGGSFTASTTNTARGGAIRMIAAGTITVTNASFDGIGNQYAIVATAGTLKIDQASIDNCTNYTTAAINGSYTLIE